MDVARITKSIQVIKFCLINFIEVLHLTIISKLYFFETFKKV